MSQSKLIYKITSLFRHRIGKWAVVCVIIVILLRLLLPKPILYEKYSFSSIVFDRNGKVLNLSLSMDDKYRLFTPRTEIPPEAIEALLLYEDRNFYYHPGVNPLSVARAIYEMASGGRRQGASTITMQLARIVYQIDSSKLSGKFEQMLRAIQIEFFYSKDEILEAYFNLAPYGGNIEGIAAAARIYFDCAAQELNLPQILALTVIPQNPSKRALLNTAGQAQAKEAAKSLSTEWQQHSKTTDTFIDAASAADVYLPKKAPHFVRAVLRKTSGTIYTTLDGNYQRMTEEILHHFVMEHQQQGINNAAALIVDAADMSVLAYVGSADFDNRQILGQVDGTKALRSPGSALKPFIYAMALEKGIIHPRTMLKDVPRHYGVYTPENFDRSFFGLVNATDALVFSRNIPAVDLLLNIGEKNFHHLLERCGVGKLKTADFYGLAAALGGIEVSMQNLAAMYAMLYNGGQFSQLRFLRDDKPKHEQLLSPEAAFLTLDMLSHNQAVDTKTSLFSPRTKDYPISWKTGTSYGFRDAWSVGVVGSYVIAVWVGNFDGTSNHAFIGRDIAAPLFFRLVRKIATEEAIPQDLEPSATLNLAKVNVCTDTGDIANAYCEKQVETYFIPGVSGIKMSNVARMIPIDIATGLRACRHCPPQTEMHRYNFWSPDVLNAYEAAGITIRRPPAFKGNCAEIETFNQGQAPRILLPADGSRFLQRPQQTEKIVLKAVADADVMQIYWFMDNRLIGQSKTGQTLETVPTNGRHEIKAVDDMGRITTIRIEVVPGGI